MTVAIAPEADSNSPASEMMILGIPKEIYPGERRVAATPNTAQKLQKLGFQVRVETGAGLAASFPDDAYRAVGCEIVDSPVDLWANSTIVLKVRAPQHHPEVNQDEVDLLRPGGTLISFIWPAQNGELLERLAQKAGHRFGHG
jgi:NAD(P) transhydrogenase subunit alpha